MLYNPGFQTDGSYVVEQKTDISSLSKLMFSSDNIDTISSSCSKVFETIHQRVPINEKNAITSDIKIDLELIPECVTDVLNRLNKQDYSPNEGDSTPSTTYATYIPGTNTCLSTNAGYYVCATSGCDCPTYEPYCYEGVCDVGYIIDGTIYTFCIDGQTTCTTYSSTAGTCESNSDTDYVFLCT